MISVTLAGVVLPKLRGVNVGRSPATAANLRYSTAAMNWGYLQRVDQTSLPAPKMPGKSLQESPLPAQQDALFAAVDLNKTLFAPPVLAGQAELAQANTAYSQNKKVTHPLMVKDRTDLVT